MNNDAVEKSRPFSDVPQDGGMRIFHGAVSPAIARVYATWTPSAAFPKTSAADLQLSGQIIGPFCDFAHTLPARMPLMARGPGETLLAEAVVPDPCCWTPELPFTYRAQIEVRRGADVIQRYERNFGIRRWGMRGCDFLFEGKRFVLRGGAIRDLSLCTNDLPTTADATFARQSSTAIVVENPSDTLCEFATESGIILIADLAALADADEAALIERLHRLAAWPSVLLAVVPAAASMSLEAAQLPNNLPLAASFEKELPPVLPSWASAAMIDISQFDASVSSLSEMRIPVIIRRHIPHDNLEQARAACDQLQREVTGKYQFAGFLG